MKSRSLLFTAFVCFCISLAAQSFRWGPETRREGYALPIGFHGTRDGGIATLMIERKWFSYKYFLEQYDQNLLRNRRTLFTPEADGRSLNVATFLATRDGFFVISHRKDADTKERHYYAQPLDPETYSAGKPMLLFKSNATILSMMRSSARGDAMFETILSRDSSKVLFFSNISEKKAENESFLLTLFDGSLKQRLVEKTVTLPYNSKDFEIQRIEVDNDGGIYLLGKRYTNRKAAEYVFTVLSYKGLAAEAREYTVEIPGVWVGEVNMAVTREGELVFAGTYSASTNLRTDGAIYFRVDPVSRKVSRVSQHPFTQRVKEDFAYGGNTKKKGVYGFDLRNMILHADGGCTLVGEQFYIIRNTTTSANGVQSSRTYYYRNTILAVSIGGDGKLDWMTTIPKAGMARDPYTGLSYAMAAGPDKLYFLYLDHIRNLGYPGETRKLRMPRGKKAIVTQATLDGTGRLTRTPVSSMKGTKTLIMPMFSAQVSRHQMVFFGLSIKRKASRIGGFSF